MTAPRKGTVTWTDAAGEPFLSDEAALAALEAALLASSAPHQHVDVIVVDAGTLARLHGDFLDDPSETDVMTFDLRDEDDGEPFSGPDEDRGADGEIYVSADRAREIAAAREGDVMRELSLYIVHGALHLAGMDDHEDADRDRMRAAERAVLASLGFSDDPAPHDLD